MTASAINVDWRFMLRNSLSSRRAIPLPGSQQFRSGQTGIGCGRIPIRPEPSPCCPAPNRTQRVRCQSIRSPDRQAAAPARKWIRPWSRLFRCPRIGTSLPDAARPVLSHAGAATDRRELRSFTPAPIARLLPVLPVRRLDLMRRSGFASCLTAPCSSELMAGMLLECHQPRKAWRAGCDAPGPHLDA